MEKLKFDKTESYEALEETFQQWAAQFKTMPETAFTNNLEIGETLERYYITLFNKKYDGKYFIKKLEYNSKMYYNLTVVQFLKMAKYIERKSKVSERS